MDYQIREIYEPKVKEKVVRKILEALPDWFKEFEVFPTLWDEANPCQIYVMALEV